MQEHQHCVRCDGRAGHNRLVVEEPTADVVGGFCRECEGVLFGDVLTVARFEEECLLCERDGFYLLPVWEPRTEVETDCGSIVVTGEFARGENAPRLCDAHFETTLEECVTAPSRAAPPRVDVPR